jgi:hypothetical protein
MHSRGGILHPAQKSKPRPTTRPDTPRKLPLSWRQGERISTAFVESTLNQVVSRRFVKKQQMQWTLRGAHLLLHTRTKVLNHELEAVFRQWYSRFRPVATGPQLLDAFLSILRQWGTRPMVWTIR